jgi:hypothetical protein
LGLAVFGLSTRLVGRLISRLLFRDVFAVSGKWFHQPKNCFAPLGRMKQVPENRNDFSDLAVMTIRRASPRIGSADGDK